MPTDWRHFRKIAERPSGRFRRLPLWVRGMADEMVRYAERPDGLLADCNDAQEVADLLFAHDDEVAQVAIAIRLLVEIGFLEERDGCLYVSNFRDAQASLEAKRKREKRNDSQKEGKAAPVSGRVRNVRTERTSPECPAASDLSGLSQRQDKTRQDLIPPNPLPEPVAAKLPTDADPVRVRAKRYDRDATGRAFLGDPREWPEVVAVVAEYSKRFSPLELREYHRDIRTRAVVAALVDYTPDQLRLAIREAARSKFSEERYKQLDCILHDPAKIDSWLQEAPQKLLKAATGGNLDRATKTQQRPAEREQSASSELVGMPQELVDRILGPKPAEVTP